MNEISANRKEFHELSEQNESTNTSSSSSEICSETEKEEVTGDEKNLICSTSEITGITKRGRKRKRRPKKKKSSEISTTAYVPDEPFKARYSKIAFLSTAAPKVHIRFDNEGNADEEKSEFNYKARIIKALVKNLTLCDKKKFNDDKEEEVVKEIKKEEDFAEIIDRKPRIIKAIVI